MPSKKKKKEEEEKKKKKKKGEEEQKKEEKEQKKKRKEEEQKKKTTTTTPVGRRKCGRGPQAASGLPTFALNSVIAILYSHVLLRGMPKNVLAAVQNGTAPIPKAPQALLRYLRR